MDVTCANLYLCDLKIFNSHVLVFCGDVIIFARHTKTHDVMSKELTRDTNLRDDGVRYIVHDLGLCSFRFIGGQRALEVRNY